MQTVSGIINPSKHRKENIPMSEKTKGEQLREELLMNPKNLTEPMTAEELKAA